MATMDMATKALIFTAGQQDQFGRTWPLARIFRGMLTVGVCR